MRNRFTTRTHKIQGPLMDTSDEIERLVAAQSPNDYKSLQLDFQTKYALLLEEKRQAVLELYQRIINRVSLPAGRNNFPVRNNHVATNGQFDQSECNQLMRRGAIVAIDCCASQMHYSGAEAACTLISMSMLDVLATNYLKINPKRSQILNEALDRDGNGWENAMRRAIQDYATWYNKKGNSANIYPFYDELVSLGLFKKYKAQTINEYGGFVNEKSIRDVIGQMATLSYRDKCAYGGIYTNSESTSAFVSTYVEDRPVGRIWVFDSHGKIYPGKSVFVLFGKVEDACRFIMENLSGGVCESDSMEAELFSREQHNPHLKHVQNCVFQSVVFKWG